MHPKTCRLPVLQPACPYTSACGPLTNLLNRTCWKSMGSGGLKDPTRSIIYQTAASHPKLLSLAELQTPNSREFLLFTSPSPALWKGRPRNTTGQSNICNCILREIFCSWQPHSSEPMSNSNHYNLLSSLPEYFLVVTLNFKHWVTQTYPQRWISTYLTGEDCKSPL